MVPDTDSSPSSSKFLQGTPFGERNRRRLIAQYFREKGEPTTAAAWERVYGMLLWVDRTTGLAHCYESDKCQPGRTWYARSLAFQNWLAAQFHSTPLEVGKHLDWLFQRALEDYLAGRAHQRRANTERGEQQRAAFAGQNFPLPGSDPEIERIIGEALKPFLSLEPPVEVYDTIAISLREYWKQENKRKNLLGEGFEDVLAATVEASCGSAIKVRTRVSIADVAGFHGLGAKDKATKVDLIVESPNWPRPCLTNVKWSIRADREDQLWDDFKEYVRFDRDLRGFDHYLITNEFDPARLNAVCDRRESNHFIFKQVVHINTAGVLAAYGASQTGETATPPRDSSMERVRKQVEQGRLVDLSSWLAKLQANG